MGKSVLCKGLNWNDLFFGHCAGCYENLSSAERAKAGSLVELMKKYVTLNEECEALRSRIAELETELYDFTRHDR